MSKRKVSDRLLTRLRELGLSLPEDTVLRRTFAGEADRSNGAWSWFAMSNGKEQVLEQQFAVGSQYPMSTLLDFENLSFYRDRYGDIHVCPSR